MRTTLTLEEDVAAKLKSRARREGRPFKDIVNEVLRRGLASVPATPARTAFRVHARDLGRVRPGVTLDNIGELLDQLEGPAHR